MSARRLRRLLWIAVAVGGCKDPPPESKKHPVVTETGASAPQQAAPPTEPPPARPKAAGAFATPETKLKRYRECWDAFNAGNDQLFAGCFAADAVRDQVDSVPESSVRGAAEILEMAKAQKAAFPDMKVTPEIVLVSGNDIAAILHVTGTNTAKAGGMKASGKKLGVFEAEIAAISDDGTFSRDSFYVDQPTIFHQLGMLENDSSPAAILKPLGEPESLISQNDDREAANKALVQKSLAAVAKKDATAIEALAADDIKFTYHGDKQKVETKKAYMRWMGETLSATKEAKIDITGIWAAGDFVAVSDVFTGRPTEEYGGKSIVTRVVQFYRIADGKIKQQHIFANRLKAAVQLGIIDPVELLQALKAAGEDKGDAKK